MLKYLLKTVLKIVAAVVIVRLAIFVVGLHMATGSIPGTADKFGKGGYSLTDFKQMGREGLKLVNDLLGQ